MRGPRVPTHPDGVALPVDVHPPAPPESGALGRDVRRRQPVAGQPLGDPGVEAAGHGVLGDAVPRAEGADLDRALAAVRVGADDADVQAHRGRPVGLDREHLLGRVQQHADPARAVVDPLEVDGPARGRRARPGRSARGPPAETAPERRNGGPAKASRSPRPQPDQARPALLHQLALGVRHSPGLEPGVRRADRRVAGERQLGARREDPQPVVRLVGGGRQQEGRLGEVGPAREPCHLLVPDAVRVVHDRDRVAEEGLGREHVDLAEAVRGRHDAITSRTRARWVSRPRPAPAGSRRARAGCRRPRAACRARMPGSNESTQSFDGWHSYIP